MTVTKYVTIIILKPAEESNVSAYDAIGKLLYNTVGSMIIGPEFG